jgi:hypothetical protein
MPMAMAVAGDGAAAALIEKKTSSTSPHRFATKKINIIKVVREVTNLSLKKPRPRQGSVPRRSKGIPKDEAEAKKFEEVGAVEIKWEWAGPDLNGTVRLGGLWARPSFLFGPVARSGPPGGRSQEPIDVQRETSTAAHRFFENQDHGSIRT